MALYIAPTLVLLPIMIVWLGIGMASKVAVVFLGAVFPIVVNTMAGMREADPRLIRAARSFGASQLDIFIRILVPGSLPAILIGIRLAIGRAVLGVVVGELFVSQAGIGYQFTIYGAGDAHRPAAGLCLRRQHLRLHASPSLSACSKTTFAAGGPNDASNSFIAAQALILGTFRWSASSLLWQLRRSMAG